MSSAKRTPTKRRRPTTLSPAELLHELVFLAWSDPRPPVEEEEIIGAIEYAAEHAPIFLLVLGGGAAYFESRRKLSSDDITSPKVRELIAAKTKEVDDRIARDLEQGNVAIVAGVGENTFSGEHWVMTGRIPMCLLGDRTKEARFILYWLVELANSRPTDASMTKLSLLIDPDEESPIRAIRNVPSLHASLLAQRDESERDRERGARRFICV